MYFFYETDEAQAQVVSSEKEFLKNVNKDFQGSINFFNSLDGDKFKIYPQTKKEAEWILYAYSELMRLEQPIPAWLLNYVHLCFSKILAGTPVKNALNLVNPSHRPPESYVAERNEKIYSDVLKLMENGMALFDAALELSEKYELHESNIQKIYSAIKKTKNPPENPDEDLNIPF
jgi:hypothetical protein